MNGTLTEVTVTVTQEHIDRGTPKVCARCPIALALLDAVPDTGAVSVMADTASFFTDDGVWFQFDLPGEAIEFIERFDETGRDSVSPFTFTAEVLPS